MIEKRFCGGRKRGTGVAHVAVGKAHEAADAHRDLLERQRHCQRKVIVVVDDDVASSVDRTRGPLTRLDTERGEDGFELLALEQAVARRPDRRRIGASDRQRRVAGDGRGAIVGLDARQQQL